MLSLLVFILLYKLILQCYFFYTFIQRMFCCIPVNCFNLLHFAVEFNSDVNKNCCRKVTVYRMQSIKLVKQLYAMHRYYIIPECIFTGRMPRSGKLLVLNLLTGQKSGFSPRRGDSLHRFTSNNLAGPTDTWVRLAVQNFTSIATGGGNVAPIYQKFPLFGKESPLRLTSLD